MTIDPTAVHRDFPQAAFIHPSALLFGTLELAQDVSIWPYAVIRADMHHVSIGARTNIQDHVMIHVGGTTPTIVGADCSITHRVTLHGCKVGDRVLVGIGSTIMDGCEIGDNCIVAGHSFLKEGTIVPPNSIVMGSPAKVTRTRDNSVANALNAWMYLQNARGFSRGEYRTWAAPGFAALAAAEQQRLAALYGA